MTPKMPTAEMTSPRNPKRPNISMLSRRSAVCAASRSSRRATFRSGTCGSTCDDDSAESRQRVVGVAARVQENEAVRPAGALRHRQVHLGVRADLEARLAHVGHDTDDAPLAVADVDDDAADRVVVAEVHPRRRVAEDDDSFRSGTIVVREVPAAPEGDRQRPVVAGGDELHAHRLVVVERLTVRLQRADLQLDPERNARRSPRPRRSRQARGARGRRCRTGPAGCRPAPCRDRSCAASTRSLRNPGSMRKTLMKLPMKSDAPTSNTTASATSTTTITPRARSRPRPAPPPRALSLSTVARVGLDPWSAGARPETRPVTRVAAAATATTRASMPTVATRARLSGNAVASRRTQRPGQGETDDGPGRRHDEALDQDALRQPAAARAECRPDGGIAPAAPTRARATDLRRSRTR